MYIQEIIIDGFKSYATRTVINGWDPSFNAITGTFAGRCRVRRLQGLSSDFRVCCRSRRRAYS